jgi:hypothetical protein
MLRVAPADDRVARPEDVLEELHRLMNGSLPPLVTVLSPGLLGEAGHELVAFREWDETELDGHDDVIGHQSGANTRPNPTKSIRPPS